MSEAKSGERKKESKKHYDTMFNFNFLESFFPDMAGMMRRWCPDGMRRFGCCSMTWRRIDEKSSRPEEGENDK